MEGAEALITKRFKQLSDDETTDDIDRLGALPDDVLCHILSFLPTKLSVSTSILAKRWRFLWTHVPVLDFHSFTVSSKIVRSVMMQHKAQHIHTFRLDFIVCRKEEFEAWIITLIDRNVQRIYIDVMLPPCLFTCKTLVDLSLGYCGAIPMNDMPVCLPALKRLCLRCVSYESDESLPHLLSGCPVLEELTINRDEGLDSMMCCYISSPTLNELFLKTSGVLFDIEYKEGYMVKLDTPALRYLRLQDSVSEYISAAGTLTSLTEAHVELYSQMTLAYARSVFEFISMLCNVEYLNLWTCEMEVPDSEFSALTTKFHNLVDLELGTDWRFITKFIENADNLQDLEIKKSNSNLKGWMDPKQVPACLVSRLRYVRIDDFGYSEDEYNVVRYIFEEC